MDRVEPRSANDYDDRTTAAVKSVLVEIGQILGSFKGKFAVIGGAVPWLLLSWPPDANRGDPPRQAVLRPPRAANATRQLLSTTRWCRRTVAHLPSAP